jgi:hypothetical protein
MERVKIDHSKMKAKMKKTFCFGVVSINQCPCISAKDSSSGGAGEWALRASARPELYLVLHALDALLEARHVERRHEVDEIELREDGRRVRQRSLLDLCE